MRLCIECIVFPHFFSLLQWIEPVSTIWRSENFSETEYIAVVELDFERGLHFFFYLDLAFRRSPCRSLLGYLTRAK